MIETGIKGKQEITVTPDVTADKAGSGLLPVFSTPAMIALIEKTAWMSIADKVAEGQGSVGTKLDVAHLAATPIGLRVWCETELREVDGRRLVFEAAVYDEKGKIGEGTHERFIIDNEKFMTKVRQKL
ncbi:MAG: thioesterase family protein [Treponema sp.]|nr:thioesterase family protein [Treponema sp.]